MYREVDWMKAADQSILQVLGPPKRLELTSGNVARNAGVSRNYASRRLGELVNYGLVEKHVEEARDPFYSITDTGVAVLTGEITAHELNERE